MNNDYIKNHKKIIDEFLRYLNGISDDYILKGGTALMCCYHLDRLSEDIDFDSLNKRGIRNIVSEFCKANSFSYRLAKDSPTTLRYMIHYSENDKPLKIETSFRRKHIASEETFRINGIRVYNINTLCIMKSAAYQMRDKIRDLFDLSFIINNYYNDLDKSTILNVQQALAYKGLEQFDYLAETQQDELINKDDLADSFMNALDKLDLLVDSDVLKRHNTTFSPADPQNEEDSELEL